MKSNQQQNKPTENKKNIAEVDEELEEDLEEEYDDQVNEKLFTMYDQMFRNFNDFGAMFQQTASCIGVLIKKNMISNQKIEELEELLEQKTKDQKQYEEAYETMIQQLTQKERQIEDLMGENTSLKIQLEQFIVQKQVVQQQQQQRDILKEREESNKNQKQQQLKKEIKNYDNLIAGTYESFFDLEKSNDNIQKDQDSCSLRDLFSLKNTKKRPEREIDNEEQKDQWISNKRKIKRQYVEDSQIAERFEQLSQAFFQISNKNSSNSAKKISQEARDSLENLKAGQGILQNNNEDSMSSTSVINACIRFDAQQAKDNLVQSKLNFEQTKVKKQEKKFEIAVVEQISDSLQEDFFNIKNQKKDDKRSSNRSYSNKSTGSVNKQKKVQPKMY